MNHNSSHSTFKITVIVLLSITCIMSLISAIANVLTFNSVSSLSAAERRSAEYEVPYEGYPDDDTGQPRDFIIGDEDDLQEFFRQFQNGTEQNQNALMLGVSVVDVDGLKGPMVVSVEDNSVASGAGFKAQDVITKATVGKDETAIASAQDLQSFIGTLKAGDEVKFTISRDGKESTLTAKFPKTGTDTDWSNA